MKTFKTLLLFVSAVLLSSSTVPEKINWDYLEGIWLYKEYKGGTEYCEKKNRFVKDSGGYEFMKDGVLRVRQNSGWCATPPISYETVEGTWKIMNDSVIHLEHPYWRGTMSLDLRITSLTKSEMAFKAYTEMK